VGDKGVLQMLKKRQELRALDQDVAAKRAQNAQMRAEKDRINSMPNAGPTAIESLFTDAIDATFVGPSPTINGYIKSRGEKFVIVAGGASGGAGLHTHLVENRSVFFRRQAGHIQSRHKNHCYPPSNNFTCLPWTGMAFTYPVSDRSHKLRVAKRWRASSFAGIPTPQHERVVIDVID
jgi:hypothetical protein